MRSQISVEGPRIQSTLTSSTLITVVLDRLPAVPVLLSVLSGSFLLLSTSEVVAPAVAPVGGVGVLAQAANSAAHAKTARSRPNFIKFSESDAKKFA
ncbi:hypothetical protein LMG26296_04957 [Cupriavidus plantarum]|nr:hypothetical protein LMG26296_04957 [Cupriavidus plantarum]